MSGANYVTVRELITRLMQADPDAIVVMASDAEGNGYSPLSDVERAFYRPNTSWSGDVVESDEGGVFPAAVLYPVN